MVHTTALGWISLEVFGSFAGHNPLRSAKSTSIPVVYLVLSSSLHSPLFHSDWEYPAPTGYIPFSSSSFELVSRECTAHDAGARSLNSRIASFESLATNTEPWGEDASSRAVTASTYSCTGTCEPWYAHDWDLLSPRRICTPVYERGPADGVESRVASSVRADCMRAATRRLGRIVVLNEVSARV